MWMVGRVGVLAGWWLGVWVGGMSGEFVVEHLGGKEADSRAGGWSGVDGWMGWWSGGLADVLLRRWIVGRVGGRVGGLAGW